MADGWGDLLVLFLIFGPVAFLQWRDHRTGKYREFGD